jgi:hypothetical protein
VGGQHHVPAALPPGKTRNPLYRRLGGPQGRSEHVRKISPPPGFDPRTVQPVVSRTFIRGHITVSFYFVPELEVQNLFANLDARSVTSRIVLEECKCKVMNIFGLHLVNWYSVSFNTRRELRLQVSMP